MQVADEPDIHLGLDLQGGTHLVLQVHVAGGGELGDGPRCAGAEYGAAADWARRRRSWTRRIRR